MIEDDKALHTSAFHQKMARHSRPCRPFVPSGNRCRAAHHDTATHGQMGKNGVADRAGGVVEIHVDAIRAERCNTIGDILALIIDGCIIAEFLNAALRSEEHTSELQSLMRISYAVFCLKKKTKHNRKKTVH